jgi:RNA polymerase subunit RPABC4/transcription elongation factor Spt4
MRCKKCNAVISSNTLNCPCCGQYNAQKKGESTAVETSNDVNNSENSSKKAKKKNNFLFSVGGLIVVTILLIGGIALYSVCVNSFGNAVVESVEENEKVELITIEKIVELSKKGEDLDWKDFEKFKQENVGKSGYDIVHFPIDDTFELIIGGMWTEKPDGIDLVLLKDTNIRIDIRTGDLQEFIETYSK